MKKILSLILFFVLIFSGCGLTVEKVYNSENITTQQETTAINQVTETSSEVTEDSFTEATTKTEVTQKSETTTKKQNTCIFYIECKTILNNMDNLKESKKEFLPSDGVVLRKTTVTFKEGETVFDVLLRVCKENNIQIESSYTPGYDNYYIEGIAQIYEKDCGTKSGWMYSVNGVFPNYGCSDYTLRNGDSVEWRYTCDLGEDVGDNSFITE